MNTGMLVAPTARYAFAFQRIHGAIAVRHLVVKMGTIRKSGALIS